MADRQTLREIIDDIDRLSWQGIDAPPTDDGILTHETLKLVETAEEAQHAELQKAFDALKFKCDTKIENIGYVLMNQDDKIEQLGKEILRLQIWKKQIESRRAWLLWYCVSEMVRAGIRKVVGKFIRVTVANNSQPSAKVPMNPHTKKPRWELIDPRFVGETREPKLLKQDAIDHYDRTGEMPEGFTITKGQHLRIR